MRFLHACASDRKRLFFEPVYSLKLGELSGRLNGFVTSERKLCFEKLKKRAKLSNGGSQNRWISYAIWSFPLLPTGMLFKCCTQRSTATGSPIWTIAVPSLVFKNLIRATLPARTRKIFTIDTQHCFTDTHHTSKRDWRACQCSKSFHRVRRPSWRQPAVDFVLRTEWLCCDWQRAVAAPSWDSEVLLQPVVSMAPKESLVLAALIELHLERSRWFACSRLLERMSSRVLRRLRGVALEKNIFNGF